MIINNFKLILPVLLICILGSSAWAQNNGNQNTTNNANSTGTGMNLNFDVFNGAYFIDPLGFQISSRQLPLEQPINIESYKLGVNDLLSVKVDASQEIFVRGLIVNPQGDITLPMIGPVEVNGLTIKEAEEMIQKSARGFVQDAKVSITLESPRPVYIMVKGAVAHPGKYLIPSQSRVDQAVYQSINDGTRDLRNTSLSNTGNLIEKGNLSLRNISVERNDGSRISADIISYLRTGDTRYNPVVEDGDVITIDRLNIESPKVSISGAVKADYEFEFSPGDTPQHLLDIGGGFEELADTSYLYIFRREASGIQKIELDPSQWSSFMLQPNDRVVAPFSNEINNSASAWVYGEVEIPGNFPILSGETSALEFLDLAGGLTDRALPQAAYLMRAGGVRNEIPNKFNADLMRRTSDQLVQGLEYLEAETRLSQDKVFIDLEDREQMSSLKLFDGDRLYIPRNENTVFVFGQVNNPGYFPFTESSTNAYDYIDRAGGFSLSADEQRVFIIKSGNSTWFRPGQTDLESGDRIFVDRVPVEELNSLRAYEVQKAQLKNQRIQLVLTAITTVTGILTTYVAIQNIRN
ncbi:SLBB domain-containing protein [Balneola sp. MJW-20]|uniref:SLBB domain-containing protein n=1 Tax=Gracilimonas aurantiaca TaxID=3234185 RepID=UPI00346738E0